MNVSIGEPGVFDCLFVSPNLNYTIKWYVNQMSIDNAGLPNNERGSEEKGQGNITSTWNFTVSPDIDIDKWNISNVSCRAHPIQEPLIDCGMKCKSDPKLLLIQGNPQFNNLITVLCTNIHTLKCMLACMKGSGIGIAETRSILS